MRAAELVSTRDQVAREAGLPYKGFLRQWLVMLPQF